MTVQAFSFANCNKTTYDVKYHSLDFGGAPVSGMLCSIDPLSRSQIHNHFEIEFFYFISGNGVVIIDNTETCVSAGMGVRIPAYSNHIIENKSAHEPLQFISFYWENSSLTPEEIKLEDVHSSTLIFSTPPTPNGDLHLGHLSGPYLAANIYQSYLQQSGCKAFHVTGRDDHQTYVLAKSLIEKTPAKALADRFSQQILATLKAYGIHLDYFIEPNQNADYAEFAKNIFKELYNKGFIIEKNEPAAYNLAGVQYLNEAFIRGKCPYCKRESDGNACEECGRPNTCIDLIDSYERLTQLPITVKPCKRLYFRLSHFEKELYDYVKSTPMSAHALAVSLNLINDGLPDICVSHPSEWGIQIPIELYKNQTIYVWFEMAAGYLWAKKHLQSEKIVHFYGFDNTFYHTLLFPAVYFALGGIKAPVAHVVNELLDLEGSKFSTSRGHLIGGRDLLSKAPIDYSRWFLCQVRPEGIRSNFMLMDFTRSINQFFFTTLKDWTQEMSDTIATLFDNKLPESGAWSPDQRRFYSLTLSYRQQILDSYVIDHFSPRTITNILKMLAESALRFFRSEVKYLAGEPLYNNLRTAIALSALALKVFALLARPIIPNLSKQLLNYLNISEDTLITDHAFVVSQTLCNPAALPTFIKLVDDNISIHSHS